MSGWKIFLVVLAVIVGCLLLDWAIQGNDWLVYRVFAPKMEAARRQTFEQSKAFIHGTIQDLEQKMYDYKTSKDELQKKALAGLIIQNASEISPDQLPADLRSFIDQLKNPLQ